MSLNISPSQTSNLGSPGMPTHKDLGQNPLSDAQSNLLMEGGFKLIALGLQNKCRTGEASPKDAAAPSNVDGSRQSKNSSGIDQLIQLLQQLIELMKSMKGQGSEQQSGSGDQKGQQSSGLSDMLSTLLDLVKQLQGTGGSAKGAGAGNPGGGAGASGGAGGAGATGGAGGAGAAGGTNDAGGTTEASGADDSNGSGSIQELLQTLLKLLEMLSGKGGKEGSGDGKSSQAGGNDPVKLLQQLLERLMSAGSGGAQPQSAGVSEV